MNAELVFNAVTEKLRNVPAALEKTEFWKKGTGSIPEKDITAILFEMTNLELF